MNTSKGHSPKVAKVAPKKAAKASPSAAPIPSSSSKPAAKNSVAKAPKAKPAEEPKVRKEEVVAEDASKANKKKRVNPSVGATGWKRVKLAEEMQFNEAGFFMLEELTYDPSDPTSLYDSLIKRIPGQPTPLEEEPVVDTNDSDLDEMDSEDDAKQGKKRTHLPKDVFDPPMEKKKEKKAETAKNASSAPASTSSETKAAKTATDKTQKKKDATTKAKVVEDEAEEMPELEAMDVDEEAAVSGSDDDIAEEDEEVEVEEDDDEDDEAVEAEQKLKGSARWREFVPQAQMEEEVELPEWTTTYNLHKRLLMSLRELEFTRPTDIQRAVIPVALGKRLDVIGASQTGSGKTLAFGLPIIQQILELDEKTLRMAEIKGVPATPADVERDSTIKALIMSPTRELGLQIVTHLEKLVKHSPHIRVASLVGGLSPVKQMRMLNRRPDILVCTPGRLWELISSGKLEQCGQSLADLRWLVFDEADKMVEFGRFAELQNIMRTVYDSRKRKAQRATSNNADLYTSDAALLQEKNAKSSEAAKNAKGNKKGGKAKEDDSGLKPLQTFVFSATISIGDDARKNLKKASSAASKLKKKLEEEKRRAKAGHKPNSKNSDDAEGRDEKMMEKLMEQIDFQREVELLDLTNRMHTVEGLEEAKMYCLKDEKDFYLYYFIMKYGGKSIVFVNAISNIKRILPLMVLLRVPAFGMHANMEQHHRMKNLEKFKESTNGVLITTDVMARGVDIPQVDHVIHYSIPTSAEIFVHRSGRTARAFAKGLSIHVVDPEDRRHYTSIMHTLGRTDDDVPDFPVEMQLYAACKKRVKLAVDLDRLSHDEQKKQADAAWLKARAADLDTDIPDDMVSDDERDEARFKQKALDAQRKKAKYAVLKNQLRELLNQPLGVHEKSLELAKKVAKHGETLAHALSAPAGALPVGQTAVSSYITKNIGAKQIFAPKSSSFQSPPLVDAEPKKETKMDVDAAADNAPTDALSKNATIRPSAAFEDVMATKGTKQASFSKEIIDKTKRQRKLRMQAMGRTGTNAGLSGPLKNKR